MQLTIVLQVANWLLALSMEMYIPRFLDSAVDGEVLLTLDSALLKQLGVINKSDRDKIKDKLKELKKQNEKEKKELEKERKRRRRRPELGPAELGNGDCCVLIAHPVISFIISIRLFLQRLILSYSYKLPPYFPATTIPKERVECQNFKIPTVNTSLHLLFAPLVDNIYLIYMHLNV